MKYLFFLSLLLLGCDRTPVYPPSPTEVKVEYKVLGDTVYGLYRVICLDGVSYYQTTTYNASLSPKYTVDSFGTVVIERCNK